MEPQEVQPPSRGNRSPKQSAEKRFCCNECFRSFVSSKDLRRHQIVHTGKREHICSVCDSAFGRKDHLMRHMKTTHADKCPSSIVKRSFSMNDAPLLGSNGSSSSPPILSMEPRSRSEDAGRIPSSLNRFLSGGVVIVNENSTAAETTEMIKDNEDQLSANLDLLMNGILSTESDSTANLLIDDECSAAEAVQQLFTIYRESTIDI